ncbi:MAG: type II toxin-antitoxin system RelE/ParE family toxin [Pseudomonadota bacterium]
MEVSITPSATEALFGIYAYHYEYSEEYADLFYDSIMAFMVSNLSEFPFMGHEYNASRNLYRLIFQKRYNIYYQIRRNQVFVLYIKDGKMLFNSELLHPDVTLPDID